MRDSTDLLIEELKRIILPFPNTSMRKSQLKEIEKQLDRLDDNIKEYRKYLSRFNPSE